MKLVIELFVDCMRCSKSLVIQSNRTEIRGNPLFTWKATKTGWICPEHDKEDA